MRRGAFFITIALLVVAGSVWPAPQIQIKLGSLVPIGSTWDLGLKRIASEWSRLSDGQVKVVIYSGGTVGDEDSMIRKMKLGQLQAAGLTARGLSKLDKTALSVALPMVVRTDEELNYVLDAMTPELSANLESAGYKVVFWTVLGWVYFYSRTPVITPDDLRKQTLWVWEGDPDEASVWKDLNFRIAQLQSTDILTSLQSGMIDAFASSPLTAAAYQWFALAKHMTDMRWAPLFGGFVVSMKTWEKIPADLQGKLLDSARAIGDGMREETRQADAEAIRVMKQYGLQIHPVPPRDVEAWAALMDQGFAKLSGKTFDPVSADKVRGLVREYRAKHGQ